MIVVDASAALGIILAEPEADRFGALIDENPAWMSGVNYVECALRLDRIGLGDTLDDFVAAANMKIAPVTPEQAWLARIALGRFGRGSGHPARLNLGDAFAYALAQDSGRPLLFKGQECAATNIHRGLPGA